MKVTAYGIVRHCATTNGHPLDDHPKLLQAALVECAEARRYAPRTHKTSTKAADKILYVQDSMARVKEGKVLLL